MGCTEPPLALDAFLGNSGQLFEFISSRRTFLNWAFEFRPDCYFLSYIRDHELSSILPASVQLCICSMSRRSEEPSLTWFQSILRCVLISYLTRVPQHSLYGQTFIRTRKILCCTENSFKRSSLYRDFTVIRSHQRLSIFTTSGSCSTSTLNSDWWAVASLWLDHRRDERRTICGSYSYFRAAEPYSR